MQAYEAALLLQANAIISTFDFRLLQTIYRAWTALPQSQFITIVFSRAVSLARRKKPTPICRGLSEIRDDLSQNLHFVAKLHPIQFQSFRRRFSLYSGVLQLAGWAVGFKVVFEASNPWSAHLATLQLQHMPLWASTLIHEPLPTRQCR